jgi:hypothetical protein
MKRTRLLLMVSLLSGLVLFGLGAWLIHGEAGNNPHAYIALGLGLLATSAIGGGLMALAFHSSRQGFDDDDREP